MNDKTWESIVNQFSRLIPLLFIIVILPNLVLEYVEAGISSISLIVTASILTGSFLTYLSGKANDQVKLWISLLANWSLGAFGILAGTILYIDSWVAELETVVLLDVFLALGILTTFLEVSFLRNLGILSEQKNQANNELIRLLGKTFVFFCLGVTVIFPKGFSWFLITFGALNLLCPVGYFSLIKHPDQTVAKRTHQAKILRQEARETSPSNTEN